MMSTLKLRSARLFAGSLAMVLATVGLGQDYHSDQRLQKPITFKAKIVSMAAFAKQFTQATGVPMAVSQNISERKITVIFKDKPASEAMDRIAGTFFCNWVGEAGGYRLSMSREAINEENRLLEAENRELEVQVGKYIQSLVQVASRPKDVVLAERDRLAEEMKKYTGKTDADSRKRLQELRTAYAKVADVNMYEMGYALKAAPTAAASLMQGKTLFASTKKGEALPLPASAVPQFQVRVLVPGADGKMTSESRFPSGAVMAMRLNPVSGAIQHQTMATGLGGGAAGGFGHATPILDTGAVERELKDEPLKKRLAEWAKEDSGYVSAQKLKSPPTVKPAGYAAKAYTIADHLEYISDSTGVPVVADAFRLAVSPEQYMQASTVGEYVKALRDQALPPVRQGYFRTEDGWLMYRHPSFWRKLAGEIPEGAFEPLESKIKGGQLPVLDDYSAFAGSLTPWQAETFMTYPPVTRFPRVPLIQAMPALRLWAALNSSQRESAYGEGLGFQSLNPAQRDLYRSAVLDLMWIRPIRESMLPLVMKGDAKKEIGLMMRDGGNNDGILGSISNAQESIGPAERVNISADQVLEMARRSVAFYFGESNEEGESYSFILPLPGK